MSEQNYDIIVIGGGPAGQHIATAAAAAGKTVAITEGYAYGGACPLRGCDPKMVLHGVADASARMHQLCGKGVVEEATISWADLMEWKRTFTEPVPGGSVEKLERKGVDTYHGYASFVDAHRVRFGEGAGAPVVRGETIVIAAGMRPAELDIPGADLMIDSEGFLDMDDMPDEMVIVGGGYIGTGFANLACLLGCRKVEVVVADPYPAAQFDPDLAVALQRANEDRGIVFYTATKATAVAKADGRLRVTVENDAGQRRELTTRRVVNCTGRVPVLDRLDLEAAGVNYDRRKGIAVSSKMATNVSHIYAVGDCADSGLPLTPVATHEAQLLVDNLFHDGNRHRDYAPIPTVCFSDPPIASVGMTHEEARRSPRNLRINHADATDWFHARRLNSPVYAYKVILDADDDTVLGAHLVGPTAHELINVFTLAIHHQLTCTQLRHQLWAYPTAASDIARMVG